MFGLESFNGATQQIGQQLCVDRTGHDPVVHPHALDFPLVLAEVDDEFERVVADFEIVCVARLELRGVDRGAVATLPGTDVASHVGDGRRATSWPLRAARGNAFRKQEAWTNRARGRASLSHGK